MEVAEVEEAVVVVVEVAVGQVGTAKRGTENHEKTTR